MCGTEATDVSYTWGHCKSILMMSESQVTSLTVLAKRLGSWLVPIALDFALGCHTWELDATSYLFESSATSLSVLTISFEVPGLLVALELCAVEDLTKSFDIKFIIGFDLSRFKIRRDTLSFPDVDYVSSNVKSCRQDVILYIFEFNEAVIKMIVKGQSTMMRHCSRTHRVV